VNASGPAMLPVGSRWSMLQRRVAGCDARAVARVLAVVGQAIASPPPAVPRVGHRCPAGTLCALICPPGWPLPTGSPQVQYGRPVGGVPACPALDPIAAARTQHQLSRGITLSYTRAVVQCQKRSFRVQICKRGSRPRRASA
jgi:hypothetical protein